MANKLKIILLAPYLPAKDTTACAKKIYDCANVLYEKGHLVYLFSFCSKEDIQHIPSISPYCKEFYLEFVKNYFCYPYPLPHFKRRIKDLCQSEKIDLLQCEKSYMSRYIPEDIKVATLLVEHDILSVFFSERAGLKSNLIDRSISLLRAWKKRHEEKTWYRRFDKIIVFSKEDAESIRKLYNMTNAEVIPLGIRTKDYLHKEVKEKKYDVLFVGNFSHFPNVDAALYFYYEILPLVKRKCNNISVVLAGASPPLKIKRLAQLDENISVTGYTRGIIELYSKSRVFIAPIRLGSGMRLKILEALVLNLPVVATSLGARGFMHDNALTVADKKEDFSEKIVSLLNDPILYNRVASGAKPFIERNYNTDMLINKYEDIYYDLLQ